MATAFGGRTDQEPFLSDRGQEFADAVAHEAQRRPASQNAKPLRQLWPYLRNYPGLIAGAAIALLASTALTLVLPIAARGVFDNGFSVGATDEIGIYFRALIFVAILLGLATGVRFFFVTTLGERIVADLRKAVYNHITTLSPEFFEVTRTGEVLSRLTTDTTLIQNVIGSTISFALRNSLMMAGAMIMLAITNLKLTGVIFASVLLVLAPIIIFGRWVRTLSRASQDRVADTSALAGESINAMQVVQAFTHEELDRERYSSVAEQAFRIARQRVMARSILTAVAIAMGFSSIVGGLWMGAAGVQAGTITGGELAQFLFYAIMVAASAGGLSEVWGEIQRAAGAAERLMELLAVRPAIAPPENPTRFEGTARGRIAIDQVTFRYPARPEYRALNNFTLDVEPGETVALVGPSGAGKSTVIQLLLRFYDPQSGTIAIDHVNIADADPSDVRQRISLVPQDTVVFGDTALENIRYGRPEASDEEVFDAARAAQADEFIERLPQKYDTHLGERGVTLSGGQRQRIAIARAILRRSPILLLDEATSALDAESERLVQGALERLMRERTTIVIAHRLATVLKADRIVVMDQGGIVATGTHDELLNQGGLYARLAKLQFDADRLSDDELLITAAQ